jgi:hypothetical protein
MGGYANESLRAPRRVLRVGLTGIAVSWLACLLAMPALADAPVTRPADTDRDRPVSTRPTALERAERAGRDGVRRNASEDHPLTRAAALRRIERMSPTEWLSQYGAVTVTPHVE